MDECIVLGFDVSSSCIGWCALLLNNNNNNNISYLNSGFIKPIKDKNIILRLADTRDKINELINLIKPTYIGIENILEFMKGKSTAKTITTLTSFNRMICLTSYDYLKKSPELFNVMSIRHKLKLNKVLPKKEEMPELVAHHLNIDFPWIINKKGNYIKENYDVADAVAVALHYSFILTKRVSKK